MQSLKKIPFDSLSLAAVTREMQELVGGRLQRIVQPSERTLSLGIYAGGKERFLFLSCSPQFARAHLSDISIKSGAALALPATMRGHVDGARIASIKQRGFDRILDIVLEKPVGTFRLIAELTGKHANLIFVGPDEKVLGAAHIVSQGQSVRPIHPGRRYEVPPFPQRPSALKARTFEELAESEGASPFLQSLLKAKAGQAAGALESELKSLSEIVRAGKFSPVQVEGIGAYPISVSPLGYDEKPAESLSNALEKHFRLLEITTAIEAVRTRLVNALNRVLLARDVALEDLRQSVEAAKNAGRLQVMAELILAFAHEIAPGQSKLESQDYEGNALLIDLDPELTPLENAQKLFAKAKKAKGRAEHVQDQKKRLNDDKIQLVGTIRHTEDAKTLEELIELEAKAKERRWLHEQRLPTKTDEEKPYEGHRIRERLGPNGFKFLFGENATSNDYLTQRVAKPNDIWMHVRGSTSAHVVIQTGNKPDRVSREALLFGAKLAVQNSTAKHSSYVPVDYTLKKYVRKPRGAKAGTASYTHEKTLHVEGGT